MVGWLENEFLKKTPNSKFELESQLGTSDLEFFNKMCKKGIPRSLICIWFEIEPERNSFIGSDEVLFKPGWF